MKKRLVVLLAGLLTVLSMGFGSAQFSDVPAGHWAKEAVEKLADEGIILGFPDGTFRGNEGLTRYQAALIIFRVLETIREEQLAQLDEETLTALRNAVQELSAELASLGVRVAALEDNAATKDDVARLEAAIAELKAMPKPEPGIDKAALKDLADRVEAAAVAADTALAQARQLSDQLGAVEGNLAEVRSLVEANADSIKALNELAVILNKDVLSLTDRVTAIEKKVGGLDAGQLATKGELASLATKDDVQAVQEFATALRGDLVNVSNKVAALSAQVEDIDSRLATVERNALTISGDLSLTYEVDRLWGDQDQFDIDRLFGSNFSSGDNDDDGKVVDEPDFTGNKEGETSATLNLKLQTNKFDATSDGAGVNTYPEFVQFSIKGQWTGGNVADDKATDAGQFQLVVDSVSTTLKVADGQALSFDFGRSVKAKFTEYVFDNDVNSRGHGFVATFKPGFALNPTITGVYGSTDTPFPDYTYFRGVRVALQPSDNVSLGASFVQEGVDVNQGGATYNPTDPGTVWGVDASAKLGSVELAAEYATSNVDTNNDTTDDVIYYVKADAKVGILSLSANYRSLEPDFNGLSGDWSSATAPYVVGGDDNAAPFALNQKGFGVSASATVGVLAIDGYYDNYTDFAGANTFNAYGGTATATFGGFSVSGYYKIAQSNGQNDASINAAAPGESYYTRYGVKAAHDGASDQAFIKDLNLTAEYRVDWSDTSEAYDVTHIFVYGDYKTKVAVLSLAPIFRYHQLTDNATPGNTATTLKYGVKASTDTFALPLAPSFTAEYAARTTTFPNNTANNTSETKYAVGVKFNEFLFENSTFEAKYGAYAAENVGNVLLGTEDKAFDAAKDHLYDSTNGGGAKGGVKGLYFTWTYWDLTFSYADFSVDTTGDGKEETHGQAFKIAYKVKF